MVGLRKDAKPGVKVKCFTSMPLLVPMLQEQHIASCITTECGHWAKRLYYRIMQNEFISWDS